jgi:hypothetical protein
MENHTPNTEGIVSVDGKLYSQAVSFVGILTPTTQGIVLGEGKLTGNLQSSVWNYDIL